MTDKFELRVYIKFCLKLGKSVTEAQEMPNWTFGEHCLGRAQVFEWYSVEEPVVTKTKDKFGVQRNAR